MRVTALSYLGLRAKNLDDWADYGTRMVGLQAGDRAGGVLSFRADERRQRLFVEADGGDGISVYGWEVADAASLDALAARAEASGIAVARGDRALAARRDVADMIVLKDPLGNRLEIGYGARLADLAFAPGRAQSGFRTGALGLGHVVMTTTDPAGMAAFYRDVLGFGVSDFYNKPFPAYFLHVNARHHSLAFVNGANGVHHLMLEHFGFDDVGQGYDLALLDPDRLAVTLGRHCGDYMTSYYTRTPSGFLIEHGWGGRLIDPATWTASERHEGPSLWGHERSWLPQDKREAARDLRLRLAAEGLRRPVQVMRGNYTLMPGDCPEGTVRGTAANVTMGEN
ncbi:MAG: VOC family protein [Alphaproteobacteria bacterium]|nr:VOC family protein [Alphaproteobacteria bacterium]